MTFFRDAMSQTGTTRRAARGFLVLSALLGCTQDSTGTGTPEVEHVGEKDAEAQQDDDDASAKTCAQQWAAIDAFVAAHSACTTDSDCVIVGDCTHADFPSVAASAAAEARALVLGNTCATQDGPTYKAICSANKCERVPTGGGCGQPLPRACPDGAEMREPGCATGVGEASFSRGCYAGCTDDATCAPGYTCQTTSVNPCVPAPGTNASCAACGEQTKLCLPAPDCEVELSLTLGDRPRATVYAKDSIELKLWLKNRTDRALDLRLDVPCAGPRVAGLEGYDVWSGCVAGACATEPVATTVSLAAGQSLPWRGAVLATYPTTCNAAGLPRGNLALSFALANVTGAKICGPAPVTLINSAP